MRHGFSLVELLVGATLGFLLLGLLVLTLVPLMGSSVRAYSRMELSQGALASAEKLAADLQHSTAAGITLPGGGTGPQMVSIQPLDWVSDQGSATWAQSLILYRYDPATAGSTGTLTRKLWPPQPPASSLTLTPNGPTPVSPADLAQLFSQPNGSEQRLASFLTSFSLARQPDGSLPMTLQMTLEEKVPGRQEPERFSLTRQIYLRNDS